MPTLEYVKTKNTSYPRAFNLIEMPTEGIVSNLLAYFIYAYS